MSGTGREGPDAAMVTAARDGDRRALDALVADSLPLVYNIIGRALNGHTDVDDVVQETLLRVVRALPGLRDPKSYRSWLVAIAVRQVRDHEQDRRSTQHRRADLDVAAEMPDPASDFAGVTILRLGLTDQRREVAEATRWLDDDDRSLLALWWLEETGGLDRADLTSALGLSGRHAAVRVQRMKEQVQTARTVVRALRADSGCSELRTLTWNWDGAPSPLWRKRFARHVRGCAVCGRRTAGMLPIDRLLGGLPLLPVPAGFALPDLPSVGSAAAEGVRQVVSSLPFGGGAHRGAHALPPQPRGLLTAVSRHPVAGSLAGAGVAAIVVAVLVTGPFATPPAPAPERTAGPLAASAAPSPSPPSASPSPSPSTLRPSRTPRPTRSAAAPVVTSAKKGVSAWRAPGASTALAKSGASWYYTWAAHREGITAPRSVEFVPMIWGADSVTSRNLAQARSAGPYLLGFNEPDMPEQANMTVEKALSLWPKLMSAGRVLGSPGVAFGADTPGGWLDRFMAGAKERGYRVDFVALHWYGADFRTGPAVNQLRSYIEAVHKRYRKPIWLTEYALIDFSDGTRYASDAQQAAFVTASSRMLASLPYVRRYAWFGLPSSGTEPNSGLFRADGRPTLTGRAFQKAR
ncbi:sigma-70 family RNA polymerase sigma factor [Sphaerisporangium sp. TRM90804]|uniref:sigma-70 family RNA polymerase sigma factor n=1 Tax=Sphaerisporangium sp. TRM90804 TaxID=3031113 RepID=UPI00244ADAC0|nr:sigma-70 family RNA polymerase sigma factor [Sphaerisporangium sp. TRM90804]MDH2426577.1 sigma-70 family RNA polymerase sigma factor [Sphaerisporangium sp. TRM90804]